MKKGDAVPKVQAFDRNMTEAQIHSGRIAQQDKKGQFSVSESEAKFLIKSGAFTRVGTGMASTPHKGYRCQNPECRHLAMFRDHCGRCGGTDLVEE